MDVQVRLTDIQGNAGYDFWIFDDADLNQPKLQNYKIYTDEFVEL